MRRLNYSPKVHAFVEVANPYNGSNIVCLTDFIVRGNTRRVHDAVSTAQLVIRNPEKIWTPSTGPVFHPQDKITIFMEKIANTPIQVFTGFLDQTPIYALYPGTITIDASCTLKRLLYTYWDPGLPFVFEFLAQYGWISDGSGNLTNYTTLAQGSNTILDYSTQNAQNTANNNSNTTQSVFYQPPPNQSGQVFVNYGPTTKYGTSTNPIPFSYVHNNIEIVLQNLKPNTTYHYQIVVTFQGGQPSTQSDQIFTTGGAQSPVSFQLNDSSIAKLVYAVLNQICGWQDNSIFIEALPANIAQNMITLYKDLAENESVIVAQLEQFLSQLIGTGAQGSASSNASASNPAGTVSPSGSIQDKKKLFQTWAPIASKYNVPLLFVVAVAQLESGYNPIAFHGADNGSEPYGYFQQTLGTKCYAYGPGSTQAVTKATASDAAISCEWFCAAAAGINSANTGAQLSSQANWWQWGALTQLGNVAQIANNPAYSAAEFPTHVAQALADLNATGVQDTSTPNAAFGPAPSVDPNSTLGSNSSTVAATKQGGNVNDPSAQSSSGYSLPLSTMPKQFNKIDNSYGGIDQGVILLTGRVGDSVHAIAPGKVFFVNGGGPAQGPTGNQYGPKYPVIEVSDGPWKGRTIFYGYVQGSPSLSDGDAVSPGQQIGTVVFKGNRQNTQNGMVDIGFLLGDHTTAPYPWVPGSSATPDATTMLTNMIQLVNSDALTPSSSYQNTGIANTSITTTPDLQSLSVSAAFNTIFNFPSIENTETALLLTGEKSYMNDTSILPFIQQLTQGSMRSFQSMPNGNIFVFFPDYFGAFGSNPYWQIDDIEILDGNLYLTDSALSTHVFVSGDTIEANAGSVSPFDQVASAGVVTVDNAGIAGFVNQGTSSNSSQANSTVGTAAGSVVGGNNSFLSTPQDVITFLQRYGVRPLVLNMPQIRSHYFELFVAYQIFQLMWARQFLSTFTFTFMPELYPGGRVLLENHGIALYIDEVYHEFDYEQGFTTTANLMAPQSLDPNNPSPLSQGLVVDSVLATPASPLPSIII